MKWIDVLNILIYTVWLVIAWKAFWKKIGDKDKPDKEKLIIFYAFTLMVAMLNLLLAMCIKLLHL